MASATFLTLIAAFAGTGEIGPLHCGSGREEVVRGLRKLALLAPGDTVCGDLDKFGSVEVGLSQDVLVLLGLDSDGDCSFELLGRLGQDGHRSEHVHYQEVLDAPAQQAVPWSTDPAATFPGQRAIRTACGVSLSFTDDHSERVTADSCPECVREPLPGLLLHSIYASIPT
ncbi:hypothetical protein [Nocardia sp. NBC_00416]|uniref:hypothetical protein n=1 Tax=Nocardia sp. NBC_00416 TaxID=2975991 RepID=UPI002E1CCAB2